jgi:predicted RND superfamily exporter protein
MQAIRDKFVDFIINRPRISFIIGLIIFVCSIPGLFMITSDFTPRIWFNDDTEVIKSLDKFEKRFGTDQVIALGVYHKDGILTKERIKAIEEITEKLWLISDVYRVDSLSNFNHIESTEDDINISPLFEELEPQIIKKKIDKNPDLYNSLISKDLKMAFIRAQIKPLFGKSPNYKIIMHDLENLLKEYKDYEFHFLRVGSIPITHAFKEISISDNIKIIPFMFGFIIILLIYYYRSFLGFFAPLLVSLFTIITSFGLLGYLSIIFNSILAAIPGILLAICLADTIHILTTFYNRRDLGNSIHAAIKFSINKNLLATVLTTVTTTISFITISFTDLNPLSDLGLLAAIGCILAWLNTYLILPPLLIMMPEKWSKQIYKKTNKKNHLIYLSDFILSYRKWIIVFFLLISTLSVYLATKNEVNSDPVKYFQEGTQIKKDYYLAKDHFHGLRGIDIEIDSEKVDGIKDPEFLKKVDSFFSELLKDEDIVQISSVLTIIKKMNKFLTSGQEKDYIIPSTREKIAELLMLYSFGLPQGLGLDNYISIDNKFIKLRLRWTLETTKEAVKKHNYVYKLAKKYGLKLRTGGYFPIYSKVNELVVESFLKSMTMAIVFVSIIILLVFRDLKLSLLAMLPNVLPLTLGAAFMSINNIYIDIGTSIVSAICLGIAVDDTIHFITHYQINYRKYQDTKKALHETFMSTGKALVLTTILLVVGFGSFIMAEFLPNHYFGILCAIVLTFALITDLLFLPAILIKDKK